MKKALVLGGGGFIGNHMVNRLKAEGFWVRAVDLKYPSFSKTFADEFVIGNLTHQYFVDSVIDQRFDEIYQFAADMGGAGYIFTGEHDADVMYNSAMINLNVLRQCTRTGNIRIFYSSSACMYPEHNQLDPTNPNCEESSAYPANPDSEYGWEKLFSERLYLSYSRNYGIDARIARYHNIYGPLGTYDGGREKSPAALCRKIAKANNGDEIEIWGDGEQTRSFLYIDECIEGTVRLLRSNCNVPVNIGSDEMVSINQMVDVISKIAGKQIVKKHISGPLGVRGRNSHNVLIEQKLGWKPNYSLHDGLTHTYNWINKQVNEL